mgnify:CR=1 FL=1
MPTLILKTESIGKIFSAALPGSWRVASVRLPMGAVLLAWLGRLSKRLCSAVLPSVFVLLLAGCGQVELYSNLTEQEANEMVNVLSAEGIYAEKELLGEKGWQVWIGGGDMSSALEVLRANGLPGDRYVSMGEIFQKQCLVSTPAEERMRYIYAVSQELSYTLRKIDGVVSARVHVVIPANDPLSDKAKPSSAAVFLRHSPDVDLRLLVPSVKDLVAHSIEGLTHDHVSLSLFQVPKGRVQAARQREVFAGSMRPQTVVALVGLVLAVVAALVVLAGLMRKRRISWRSLLGGQQGPR